MCLSLPPSQYFTRKSDPGWQMENNCQKKYFAPKRNAFHQIAVWKLNFATVNLFFFFTTWGLLLCFTTQLAVNSCLHSYLELAIEQQALIISLNLSLHCTVFSLNVPFGQPSTHRTLWGKQNWHIQERKDNRGEQCSVSIHVVNIHAQRTTNIVHCGRQRTNLPPAVIFPHKWLTQAK